MNGIRLDDKYVILVDDYNYTLSRIRIKKSGEHEGEEYYTPEKYYHSLKDALKGYYGIIVRDALSKGEKTLSQALTTISECLDLVVSVIESAVPGIEVKKV